MLVSFLLALSVSVFAVCEDLDNSSSSFMVEEENPDKGWTEWVSYMSDVHIFGVA